MLSPLEKVAARILRWRVRNLEKFYEQYYNDVEVVRWVAYRLEEIEKDLTELEERANDGSS